MVRTKIDPSTPSLFNEAPASLDELNRIISEAKPLVATGGRAVLGEGPVGAPIAFVGEQPGDREDIEGRPFVGPAGKLLDRALSIAGIDRAKSYLTNAVKHFKYKETGKRRLHQSPTSGEIKHYRWWLQKELELVDPYITVALGGTAVQALAGKALPITRFRGETTLDGRRGFITVHPSYLLRLPEQSARDEAFAAFVADLRRVRQIAMHPAAQ